jgi:hypothetical protein
MIRRTERYWASTSPQQKRPFLLRKSLLNIFLIKGFINKEKDKESYKHSNEDTIANT